MKERDMKINTIRKIMDYNLKYHYCLSWGAVNRLNQINTSQTIPHIIAQIMAWINDYHYLLDSDMIQEIEQIKGEITTWQQRKS